MHGTAQRAAFAFSALSCWLAACGGDPDPQLDATPQTSGSSSSAEANSDETILDPVEDGESGDTTTTTTVSSTGSSGEDATSVDDGASTGSESSGVADATSTSSDTGGPAACGSADGMAPHTLCGVVRSLVAPDPAQDGIGTLWIIATGSCSDLVNEQIIGIESADFSEIGNEVAFEIDVPFDDTWYLTVFLDENSSGDPEFPTPWFGDLGSTSGPMQLACESMNVTDDVGGIVYELTEVL
jgi:hypothetical protein